MKKKYIKPTICGIVTLTENNLLDTASQQNGPNNGFITEDDGEEEVDAAAKGNSAWESWDEY